MGLARDNRTEFRISLDCFFRRWNSALARTASSCSGVSISSASTFLKNWPVRMPVTFSLRSHFGIFFEALGLCFLYVLVVEPVRVGVALDTGDLRVGVAKGGGVSGGVICLATGFLEKTLSCAAPIWGEVLAAGRERSGSVSLGGEGTSGLDCDCDCNCGGECGRAAPASWTCGLNASSVSSINFCSVAAQSPRESRFFLEASTSVILPKSCWGFWGVSGSVASRMGNNGAAGHLTVVVFCNGVRAVDKPPEERKMSGREAEFVVGPNKSSGLGPDKDERGGGSVLAAFLDDG